MIFKNKVGAEKMLAALVSRSCDRQYISCSAGRGRSDFVCVWVFEYPMKVNSETN